MNNRPVFFFGVVTWLVVLLAWPAALPAQTTPARTLAEIDALLQAPDLDFRQAEQARTLYDEMLAAAPKPAPPVLLMRLCRVAFIQGELAPKSLREKYYEQGYVYAERLVKEHPERGEGYYWLGMHLCGQADAGGCVKGFKLLPRIFEALKRAVALNGTYDQAGPHRVLGRIYFEAPCWPMSVGDLKESREHLTEAVRLAPENSTNHLYLAETLLRLQETNRARQELEKVLTATSHAILPRGFREDQQEARSLLAKLGETDPKAPQGGP